MASTNAEQPPAGDETAKKKERKKRKMAPSKYMDQVSLELIVPEFAADIISKTVQCGYFKWQVFFFEKKIRRFC